MAVTREQLLARVKSLDVFGAPEPEGPSKREELLARVRVLQRERRRTPAPRTTDDPLVAFSSGITRGVANVFGAPTDISNALLRAAGVDVKDAPAGGSESIIAALNWLGEKLGVGPLTPEAAEGARGAEIAQRGGEIIGESVPAAAAILKAAQIGFRGGAILGPALKEAGEAPLKFAAGEAVAAVGAAAGGATAEAVAPNSALAQTVGQTLGGLGGGLTAGAVRAVGGTSRETIRRNLKLYDRAGVRPSLGQASESTAYQFFENAVLRRFAGGISHWQRHADSAAESLAKRLDTLATDLSADAGAEFAGEAVQKGIQGYIQRFRAEAGRRFDKLDKYIPKKTPVALTYTRRAVDDLTTDSDFGKAFTTPGVARVARGLENTGQQVEYKELKKVRSAIGRMMTDHRLVSDFQHGELRQVYAALSKDMRAAVSRAGPGAEDAFNSANQYWESGLKPVEQFFNTLARKAEPEKVFNALFSSARSGPTQIRNVLRSLEADERDVFVGEMIRKLGKANPGSMDISDFSVDTFATRWNQIPEASRRELFGSGQLASDLETVANTAMDLKRSARFGANPSESGRTIGAQLASVLGFATGQLPIVITAMIANKTLSTLMTSPRFIRWLAESSTIPAERLPVHFARLSQAVQGEPITVQDAALELAEIAATIAGAKDETTRDR